MGNSSSDDNNSDNSSIVEVDNSHIESAQKTYGREQKQKQEQEQQGNKIVEIITKLRALNKECIRLQKNIKSLTEQDQKMIKSWFPEIDLSNEVTLDNYLQVLINKTENIADDFTEQRYQKLTDEENERVNKLHTKYCSSTTVYKL
jgi:hypothetical protein